MGALGLPMLRVMAISISTKVKGNPAPGAAASAVEMFGHSSVRARYFPSEAKLVEDVESSTPIIVAVLLAIVAGCCVVMLLGGVLCPGGDIGRITARLRKPWSENYERVSATDRSYVPSAVSDYTGSDSE